MESSIEVGSVLFAAFLISAMITGFTRKYSIHKKIMDVPNERSSHFIPTPRGGGVAVVFVFLLATICLKLCGNIDYNLTLALVGGGSLVSLMGYLDDVYSLKARYRIVIHFLAALWALYWLKGLPVLDFGTWRFILNGQGSFIALLGIVWCINLYNFMDGIDGLAGMQGFFISVASSLTLYYLGAHQLGFLLAFLAAALSGFTVWNWPPAKIFLGDVGSGFLGFVFAVLAIYTANQHLLPLNFWLIILSIFICDATFTLVYRAFTGQKWYSAHKEHAYQRLISLGLSHKQITVGIFALNTTILFPLSLASIYWQAQGFWLMGINVLCLLLIWLSIKNLSFR